MTDSIDGLFRELEEYGRRNDAAGSDRSRRMLNIKRETGEFLAVLVNSMNARNILEIGTSNGYSTLWLARAASKIGGKIRTIEQSEFKVSLARTNFERSGLAPFIQQIHDEAGHALGEFPDEEFDLIFLDTERREYVGWWPRIKRLIRPGGLLVFDNATSHPEEMRPIASIIAADDDFWTSTVPVGNGEFLASRLAKQN